MGRWRRIDVRMWNDERFRKLSAPNPCGRYLWIFLLTYPGSGAFPGLFNVGEAGLADAIGWDVEATRFAIGEAKALGMIEADAEARILWVPNAVRYNPPTSVNVIKAWAAFLDEAIPPCALKEKAIAATYEFLVESGADALALAFRNMAMAKPLPSGMPNGLPSGTKNKNKNKNKDRDGGGLFPGAPEEDEDAAPRRFVALWNEVAVPAGLDGILGLTPSRRKHVRARLKERTLAEWRDVVERVARSRFCRGLVPSRDGTDAWKATFDWLVRSPDPALRVLEGKYDDRGGDRPPPARMPTRAEVVAAEEERLRNWRPRVTDADGNGPGTAPGATETPAGGPVAVGGRGDGGRAPDGR